MSENRELVMGRILCALADRQGEGALRALMEVSVSLLSGRLVFGKLECCLASLIVHRKSVDSIGGVVLMNSAVWSSSASSRNVFHHRTQTPTQRPADADLNGRSTGHRPRPQLPSNAVEHDSSTGGQRWKRSLMPHVTASPRETSFWLKPDRFFEWHRHARGAKLRCPS